jgi:hypothetical protein
MAAKKATKKAASKKTESKKADSKKTEPKVKAAKPVKTKEPKAAKPKAAPKASKKDKDADGQMETPSTLAMAAEKAPPKKKRMTKKQLADQTERDELTEKWAKLKDLDHESKAQKYKMSEAYEPNTPVEHPVFGWGFILSLNENKLEVLFESGIKMLVSNFKA